MKTKKFLPSTLGNSAHLFGAVHHVSLSLKQGMTFRTSSFFLFNRLIPLMSPTLLTHFQTGYINVTPPKFDLVIQDCDAALALDPKYVKALNRRATAFEGLLRWQEALRGTFCVHPDIRTWTNPIVKFADFTAATILDRFQNQTTANAVERVLKMLSAEKARDLLSVSFFFFQILA